MSAILMRAGRIGVLINIGHQIIEHHSGGFLIDIGIDLKRG
jgi:hypothetical protein